MGIHVAISHTTHYRYDRPVRLSPQLVRLRPAPHARTAILSYSQRVAPSQHFINWHQDPQSNYVARLMFPEPVRELRIDVDLVAEMAIVNPFDFFLESDVDHFPFSYTNRQRKELQPFFAAEPTFPRLRDYLAGISRERRRTVDFLVDLNQQLSRDIAYVIRLDPGVQTIEQTLTLASGSCRDSTWLLVQLMRQLGLAARFVSGYLVQLAPDIKAIDGAAGPERDFTDLHAWCEVYVPGAEWIGLDPTSGLLAGEGHIPLACTPDPSSAAPLSGSVDDCEVEFEHLMSVVRVSESPRVTKPYSDDQWSEILALGHAVDADLASSDVRLTMGGEPTFVSVTDRDGAEWNTDALGPTKRHRATDLLTRLKRHFGKDGFVHFGQGKWYPGEQLPRWALGCYWRADGEPVWTNAALFADETAPSGQTAPDADRFLRRLATKLGVTDAHIQAGYEDVWYYLWRERRLPTNVDPFDARLDDELERDRLRRVFSQGLESVVGYALPLTPSEGPDGWRTGPWFLRTERMYLFPGDSPMGFRLPLDSLPWAAAGDLTLDEARDPFDARPLLPPRAAWLEPGSPRVQARTLPPGEGEAPADDRAADVSNTAAPARFQSTPGPIRTALCAEARSGTLYVFMPPLGALERYLELVTAIEVTADALGMRVLLEGYPPPSDSRLHHFMVTPDPGVIEVNIHPGASWPDLVDQLPTILYEEARHAGLTTERFMLDGRHTGTGGGNHFVLGGPTASDSPFLRRPDLLRSLVSYWHNHPSLSYLFSGLFLGPTSQAPRLDEARHDSVYELEIAFDTLPGIADADVPPWLVDRALRHLLVDVTGNTHRAEFCIDKMYSPDSSSGRRGLLELRAFEMPPHGRMSLAQQVLLRALIARFWRTPYTTPLVRWGTELHDRFMLPYLVELDFADVIEEMQAAGYAMDGTWFRPHFAFRFPEVGDLASRAIHLTLRHALEPWHVLGEERAAGGTVRYVDSSVERLEARVTGLIGDRFVVTCNGRPLPLHATARNGERVAGVRFRAWQPASCLHPTIPVHAPLTFDIVDTWMERSVAGCQYHVAHPGGRNYEQFPVNAYEAETRRRARFSTLAHTHGRVTVPETRRSLEFPYTLDLRTR